MQVVVTATAEDAARAAARAVLERLPRGGTRAPVLGLATGSSPLGLYRELALAAGRGEVDFS